MGLCKCRQCGVVVPSKVWAATTAVGACPGCGHKHFSISFPPPASVVPAATAVIPAMDAHGRRRKIIRLEDLTGGTAGSTTKPSFKERMRDYGRWRPLPSPDEDV